MFESPVYSSHPSSLRTPPKFLKVPSVEFVQNNTINTQSKKQIQQLPTFHPQAQVLKK